LKAALDEFFAAWGLSLRWTDFILYARDHPNCRIHDLAIFDGAPVDLEYVTHRIRFSGGRNGSPSLPKAPETA